MGVTRYLADKSALARLHLPAVREELEPLIMRALVGICGVTELEMLFSARNIQERSRMKEQLAASLDRVDTPQDIWDQAAEIQEALTEQAQHRSASIPDLIVAATARARGLEILHYDRDFDTIARYTEQPARWIVPPGTVLSLQRTIVIPGVISGYGSARSFAASGSPLASRAKISSRASWGLSELSSRRSRQATVRRRPM